MASKRFQNKTGFQLNNSISIIAGVGAPGTTAGSEPDLVLQGSLYTDNSTGLLYRKVVNGTGTSAWQLMATEKAPTVQTGITTTLSLLDEVETKKTRSMKWSVDLEDEVDTTKKNHFEVLAAHDGDDITDAISIDWTVSNEIVINGGVGTYNIDVVLSGIGVNQLMQLYVSQ